MRCFIGIDLGSTTTKAVVVDEHQNILGRGITNSRSNYDTAAAIAKQEALVNSRFHLFREALGSTKALNGSLDAFLGQLERDFGRTLQVLQLETHTGRSFDPEQPRSVAKVNQRQRAVVFKVSRIKRADHGELL